MRFLKPKMLPVLERDRQAKASEEDNAAAAALEACTSDDTHAAPPETLDMLTEAAESLAEARGGAAHAHARRGDALRRERLEREGVDGHKALDRLLRLRGGGSRRGGAPRLPAQAAGRAAAAARDGRRVAERRC